MQLNLSGRQRKWIIDVLHVRRMMESDFPIMKAMHGLISGAFFSRYPMIAQVIRRGLAGRSLERSILCHLERDIFCITNSYRFLT